MTNVIVLRGGKRDCTNGQKGLKKIAKSFYP